MKAWKILLISALTLVAIAATITGVLAANGTPQQYVTPYGTGVPQTNPTQTCPNEAQDYGMHNGAMMNGYGSNYPQMIHDDLTGTCTNSGISGAPTGSFAPGWQMGEMMGGYGMGMR